MKAGGLLYLIGLLFFACPADAVEENKQYCFAAKEEYGIIPGESFGSLPKDRWREYLAAECFRHFCEPHPKSGKGVFKCKPLPGVALSHTRRLLGAADSRRYCIDMKETYHIVPGKSFGDLQKNMWRLYMDRNCDRFFCKPHPMSGRGSYDCIPHDGISQVSRKLLSEEDNKKYCFSMKDQFNIIPGEDFGTLPQEQHRVYLAARCYRYFCEPHHMSGRGVFKCIPLMGVIIPSH